MIHHDKDNRTAREDDRIGKIALGILVALLLLAPIAAAAFTAYTPNDQRRTDAIAAQKEPNVAHGADPRENNSENKPAKPSESYNDTPFYNKPTPASKLTGLYYAALAKAVKNKDAKSCETGLENFRDKLTTAHPTVIQDIEAANEERAWKVPTYDAFLDATHIRYACQQATKLNLMSDLAPDTRARNALAIIGSDVVTMHSEGSEVCFDLLSVDYTYYVQNTTTAGKVMLSLQALTLPQELTTKQFKTLCEDKNDKDYYHKTA